MRQTSASTVTAALVLALVFLVCLVGCRRSLDEIGLSVAALRTLFQTHPQDFAIVQQCLSTATIDLPSVRIVELESGMMVRSGERELHGEEAQSEIRRLRLQPALDAMMRIDAYVAGMSGDERPCKTTIVRRGGGGVLGIAGGWLWCEPGATKPDEVDTFVPIEGSGGWYIYQQF